MLMEDQWTGDRNELASSSAHSAATPDATSETAASASPRSTADSSGIATTGAGSMAEPALHPRHAAWIEARGISVDLAAKLGLKTVHRGGKAWLAVPYVEHGRTVNHKYRLTSEKRHEMDAGSPLVLWNHDCLLTDSDQPLVICEGEWDAMVAMQLDWRVVSVPNGASSAGNAEGKGYDYLWRARDAINRCKGVILAVDDDPAGRSLRTDLISLLGADRCSFVEYPFPCKDLNEVLRDYGADAVHKCLREARPVPVRGLYKLSDFPDPGPVQTMPLGIPGLDAILPLSLSTLTILTGWAGQGKTSLTVAILAHLIKHNVPVAVGTFETMPRPILERKLRAAVMGIAESAVDNADTREADALMDANLRVISQMVGEDDEMSLEDVLELARVAVQRDGVKLVLLDPWNEIEHKHRRDENETQYANRAIRQIKHFMRTHNVAFWLVAHPSKPDSGKTIGPPGLYAISGSSAWANKADYGLTYSRPDKESNRAKVIVTKVRMGLPGREGEVELAYDWRVSAFTHVS